ncbi:MAG: class I SAM-dependent methyltransferase [Kiloniellales bacterium]|nr:class I SAM-dependent methyltransferase [Kiloniellales bacterium]
MSRLESFIRRLTAQRVCLDHAVSLASQISGPFFELGLGNGRTFDHLREKAPGREIFVFERKVAAHPDCVPEEAYLFEGPIEESLPKALPRFAEKVALIHADLGSGRLEIDSITSAFVSAQAPKLLCQKGLILSDQPLTSQFMEQVGLPDSVPAGRYYLFRKL